MILSYLIVFTQGTLGGIAYFEMLQAGLYLQKAGLLEKQIVLTRNQASSELEIENTKVANTRRIDPLWTFIARTLADAGCFLVLSLLILRDQTTLKHYTRLLPWIPVLNDAEVVIGVCYAVIFLLALFSEKSFNRLFHWNVLTYAGRISFSLYLWHPIFLQIVFNGIWGKYAIQYDWVTQDSYTNNFFDLFFIALAASWVWATILYWIIEVPALQLCTYLIGQLPKRDDFLSDYSFLVDAASGNEKALQVHVEVQTDPLETILTSKE